MDKNKLLRVIAEVFGITERSILSKYNGIKQNDARRVFSHIMRRHYDLTWNEISLYLCRRSHYTSFNCFMRCEDLLDVDRAFRANYDEIERRYLTGLDYTGKKGYNNYHI